jgi:hypothetical protein
MSSLATDIQTPGRPEVLEVSPGVYMYHQPDGTWWINNAGFLTGPQGVISIDSCATRPASGRDAGLTPLEAARQADLGRFAEWPDAERIAANLHRAYAELDGAPPGAPIDIIAALTDMVAYNGGAPLTCLA